MSVLADVLAGAGRGRSANAIAADLGIDVGVVEAALDHGERLGLVVGAGSLVGCGGCPGPGEAGQDAAPAACRGCPVGASPRQPTRLGTPRWRPGHDPAHGGNDARR